MPDFVLTVGTEPRENSTVDAFPTGFPSAVVLNAAPTRTIVVGDTLIDSASSEYLITVVTSQTAITVIDYKSKGNGSPLGGSTGRSDADLTLAEADITNYAASGDTIELRCYNDGTLDDHLSIIEPTLGTTGRITITSPVGERHTGSAGTGFVFDPSTDGHAILANSATNPAVTLEFLEITGFQQASGSRAAYRINAAASSIDHIVDSCIIHDDDAGGGVLIGFWPSDSDVTVKMRNCLIYDMDQGVNCTTPNMTMDNCVVRNNSTKGLKLVGSGDIILTNTAVFDNGTAANTFDGTFSTSSDFNASDITVASIPGGDTGNNLGGLTASDEFVDLTDGSEDFRLKSTSALVDAGTDLSSTFTRDCIGNIRGINSAWDIGAFDWDTVVATVGSNASGTRTISSFAGEAPEWEVTLNSVPESDLVVGDMLVDDNAVKFLIRKISGKVLTVRRTSFADTADPAIEDCTFTRAYANISLAETDIGNIVEAGNGLTWLTMNDAGTVTRLTINDQTLGDAGHLTITAPVGERHTGTAGTGWLLNPVSNGNAITIGGNVQPAVTVEFIEIFGLQVAAAGFASGVRVAVNAGSGTTILQNLIVHDFDSADAHYQGIRLVDPTTVRNCLIYDIHDNGTQDDGAGIRIESDADASIIDNCTIQNCDIGIADQTGAANIVLQNTVVVDCDNAFLEAGTFATPINNASDEAVTEIPGDDNGTNIGGLTSADEFKDLTDGSEDFRLKPTSKLHGTGADLSGTFTKDIISRVRGVPFAIGAFESPRVAQFVPAVLGGHHG